MNAHNNAWYHAKLEAIVHEDREIVQQIRLSSQAAHDLLGRHYTTS